GLAIPSIFEVFTTALDIVEMKVARSRLAGEPADVLLTPLLPDFRTMEFHRGAAARGVERHAEELVGQAARHHFDLRGRRAARAGDRGMAPAAGARILALA